MRCLITLLCLIAVTAVAAPSNIRGRVLDRAGRSVSHARIRAFHAVPLLEYPPPGTWDGLLGQAHSDARGYFTLRVSGRASVDHLLVDGRGYFSVLSSPLPARVRVVLNRKIPSPEETVQQLLKRLHRKTPDQDPAPQIPALQERYVITYYDRNRDGVVDFELHDIPGMADAAWALSDTTFGGRYTVRLKFGVAFERKRVDLPVPKQVKITKGKPPVFVTQ